MRDGLGRGGKRTCEGQCTGVSEDGESCRQAERKGHVSRSILNMLNLKCLQDIQVEMSYKQLAFYEFKLKRVI